MLSAAHVAAAASESGRGGLNPYGIGALGVGLLVLIILVVVLRRK